MTDPMKAILEHSSLKVPMFPPTSRYHGVDTSTARMADGRTVAYLRRRFVPAPERFWLVQEHTVTEGERPDGIAARYLGDPERFWVVCDSNNVIHPYELTETTGRKIRITLPEGIPGSTNA